MKLSKNKYKKLAQTLTAKWIREGRLPHKINKPEYRNYIFDYITVLHSYDIGSLFVYYSRHENRKIGIMAEILGSKNG